MVPKSILHLEESISMHWQWSANVWFSKSASADEIRLLRTDAFSTGQGGGCKFLEFMDRHVAEEPSDWEVEWVILSL